MASPRKYKPKGYFRGGRVLDDMPIADDAPADGFPSGILGDAPAGEEVRPPDLLNEHGERPPDLATPAAPPAEDNPLQRALDAQRRAEELQRSPIAREIDKLPLSEFKKQFLKHHPELVTDGFRAKALGFYHQQALTAGIADDTPEMNAAILQGVDREIAHVRRQAIENVRMPVVEPEPVRSEVSQLQEGTLPKSPPVMPPPARRVPVSAPVSRDAPTYTGRAQSESVGITLSAEERDIARRSYSAPDMTDAQKEYAYAKAKQRLRKLRADGSYPEPERN